MTTVAGCVRLRGDARDDVSMVRRMLARMSTDPSVVVGGEGAHLGIAGSPPVRHPSGLLLTWDGRLDLSPDQARPDADVVADALVDARSATRHTVAGLVGDFALAAWFPRDRRLCLARDFLGLRPLYYASTPDVFWWASSLAGVLAPEWLPRDLNEGYFAEYLASAPVSLTETPVRNVWRVPQAHTLDFFEGTVRLTRYWHPDVTAGSPRVFGMPSARAFALAPRHVSNSAADWTRRRWSAPRGISVWGGLKLIHWCFPTGRPPTKLPSSPKRRCITGVSARTSPLRPPP